jgi:hypothetical protein
MSLTEAPIGIVTITWTGSASLCPRTMTLGLSCSICKGRDGSPLFRPCFESISKPWSRCQGEDRWETQQFYSGFLLRAFYSAHLDALD